MREASELVGACERNFAGVCFSFGWWGYEFIHSVQPIGSLPLACGEEVEKCSSLIGRLVLFVDAVGPLGVGWGFKSGRAGGRVCDERTHTDEMCDDGARVWQRESWSTVLHSRSLDLPLMGKRRPHAEIVGTLASISFIKLNVASRRVSVVFGYS